MHPAVAGILLVVLAAPLPAADPPSPKPPSPREQFEVILKAYQDAEKARDKEWRKAFDEGKVNNDSAELGMEKQLRPDKTAAALVALAEKYPKDPVALQAALWVLTKGTLAFGPSDVRQAAARVITEHFLASDALAAACPDLLLANNPDTRALLQVLRERSPNRRVRGRATEALAQALLHRAAYARSIEENPRTLPLLLRSDECVAQIVDVCRANPPVLDEQAAGLLQDFAARYAADTPAADLAQTMDALKNCTPAQVEPFFRTLLDKDPREDIQMKACLVLAQIFKEQVDRNPFLAREYHPKAEALFERAAAKYANAPDPVAGTVGARARAELVELRHLVPGKTAPDLEGRDQDGRKVRLSDFRGQVVLLDFWSRSSEDSTAIRLREQELLKAHQGKPLVVLGVSMDEMSPAALKEFMDKEGMSWRSLADGRAVAKGWNIRAAPVLLLLDHKGIVWKRWSYRPDGEDLQLQVTSALYQTGRDFR